MFEKLPIATILKLSILVAFFFLIVLQTLSFPGKFRYMAEVNPADASLRWPLTVLFFLWFLALEIVLVCIWKLVSKADNGTFFTSETVPILTVIIRIIAIVWVSFCAWLIVIFVNADDPGFPLVNLVFFVFITLAGLSVVEFRKIMRVW